MAKKADHAHPGKRQHPVLIALTAVVVVVAAAVILVQAGVLGSRAVSADDLSRVLIVAASPDENGSVVAQVIAVVDVTTTPATLEPVSPALNVTIPGTTYDTLADAYPFGGGRGVAEALARARNEEPLPYVALTADELAGAVEAAGGMRVTLPAAMSVFDGEDLYTFKAGEQTLSAARLQAVLKGAPYLADAEREKLDAELGAALAGLLAESPEPLASADTDLDESALAALRVALGSVGR